MSLFKKICPYFKKISLYLKKFSKNRRLVITSSVLLAVFFLFFILRACLYASAWRFLPSAWRAEIALNRLALSVYEEPYCRSDCYLERLEYYQPILSRLKKKKFAQRLEQIVLNEEEDFWWRLEILRLLARSDDFSLSVFQSDLDSDYLDPEIKKQLIILAEGSLEESSFLDQAYQAVADTDLSRVERLKALDTLSLLAEEAAEFYFFTLAKEKDLLLASELLRALASDPGRWDLDQDLLLPLLEDLLRSDTSLFSTRRFALFILSDLLSQNNNSLVQDLFSRLINSEELDDFSRYLAIDIFSSYAEESLALPKLSSADWAWYYSQP